VWGPAGSVALMRSTLIVRAPGGEAPSIRMLGDLPLAPVRE
jgi:hypothetical protein